MDIHAERAMNDLERRRRFPLILLAVAIAAVGLQLMLFWPGIMVWDAIRQYAQALSGHYDDWHPPAMNWLWRQLRVFGSGPAPMLVLQALLYWGGLALLAAAALREGRHRLALAIGAIALMPIALVLVGTILKDSLMAGALLVAAGLIGWSRASPARWPRIAAAALLLGAATLRFNAMPACLPLAFVLLPPTWREGRARQIMATLLIVAALLAAMPLANRALNAAKSDVQLSLVVYDLAGITRYSGSDAFPELGLADLQAINARCYSAIDWDAYAWWGPDPCPIQFAAVRDRFRNLDHSPNLFWADQVVHHPFAYAAHRLGHFDHDVRFIVDERRLHPLSLKTDPRLDPFEIERAEGVPFGDDHRASAPSTRSHRRPSHIRRSEPPRLLHALGIIGTDLAPAILQRLDDRDRRRVAHVVGVGLEGQAEHGDRLAAHRAAAGRDDLAGHRALAVVVDGDDRLDDPQRRAVSWRS
jgi:hypothetical protein